MEIFGEQQGRHEQRHDDAAIHRYFAGHWRPFFPDLGSYQAFARQCAALIKQRILEHLFPASDTIHLLDGFPIPVCRACRRCRTFRGEAATARPRRSRPARPSGHHSGGHGGGLHGGQRRQTRRGSQPLRQGPADRRQRFHLWRAEGRGGDIDLQTPLRKNMPDPRPDTLARLMRVRRAPPSANSPTCSPPRRHATSEALSIAWPESSSPTTSPSCLHKRDSQKTRQSGFVDRIIMAVSQIG